MCFLWSNHLFIVPGPSVIHLCVVCSRARPIVTLWIQQCGCAEMVQRGWVHVGGWGVGSPYWTVIILIRRHEALMTAGMCGRWRLAIKLKSQVWQAGVSICVDVFICIFRMLYSALAVSLSMWLDHIYLCQVVINHKTTFYFFCFLNTCMIIVSVGDRNPSRAKCRWRD